MSELSSRTKDALTQYRAEPAWTDDDKDRGWSRLQAAIEAGDEGPALGGTRPVATRPAVDVPRTALRIAVAVAAAAAVLLLIRAVDWRSLSTGEDGQAREQAVFGHSDAPSSEAATRKEMAAPGHDAASTAAPSVRTLPQLHPPTAAGKAVEPPAPSQTGDAGQPAPPRKRATSPSESAEEQLGDPLRDEIRLMQRARAALAKDDGAAALAALRLHRQRHPNGQMSEDRDALQPQALCAAGRDAAAATSAAAFAKAHPGSSHLQRVQTTLRTAKEKRCSAP